MRESSLQVNDLRISFRTTNGKVQAVRGIDFTLYKGETLAIVGESGSGKSVTSKAILGILAGNSIIEGGEIIYDGQDLLKIKEDEFHQIRGDRIAMIFQDPMSSLNPIVKIGKQLTEAMLLKGKVRRKDNKKKYKKYLSLLRKNMVTALPDKGEAGVSEQVNKFDRVIGHLTAMRKSFNTAHEAAQEALSDADIIIFELEKKAPGKGASFRVNDIVRECSRAKQPYVVNDRAEELTKAYSALSEDFHRELKVGEYDASLKSLYTIRDILKEALDKKEPDFRELSFGELYPNESYKKFHESFLKDIEKTQKMTADAANSAMKDAISVLADGYEFFSGDMKDKKACDEKAALMSAAVDKTKDVLAVKRDSLIYSFSSGIKGEIVHYYRTLKNNDKALAVYKREKKKYERAMKKGNKSGWELADAAVVDPQVVQNNILRIVSRLKEHLEQLTSEYGKKDFKKSANGAVAYLSEMAAGSIEKVTKRSAREKAIRLMAEVGIAEPHKRFYQYPFEFSGGMRQRIVIAIALAANPDILICDEPTTALDVTIQAQILELINKIKNERQLSIIFITHDLGVVANMADRVAVMYAGKIVEYGTTEDIFYEAAHPYTWALLSSMPDLDTNERLEAIPGTPPNMIYPPKGDAFAPRNKYAMQIDFEQQPPMFKVSDTHYAATWLLHPDAPKVARPKIIEDRIARMKKQAKEEAGNEQ